MFSIVSRASIFDDAFHSHAHHVDLAPKRKSMPNTPLEIASSLPKAGITHGLAGVSAKEVTR